jgi:hypothetical protein
LQAGDNFRLTFLQFAYQRRCENTLRFEAGYPFFKALFIKSLTRLAC